MSVRFTQSCPTCGRRVQVRVSLVGYDVACPHCQSHFRAGSDQGPSRPVGKPSVEVPVETSQSADEPNDRWLTDSSFAMMQRVDSVLDRTRG